MTQYHTSFKFDAVVVLDSLPLEENPQTGEWLRDTVLKPLAGSQGFITTYSRVENSAQLFSALSEVERLVRQAGHAPILHFETHGTQDGIGLADHTVVPWQLLRAPLTAINRACRMNLLAVMSMCHGAHLVSQLQPVDTSPVWALIGATSEMFPSRLQEAFQAFYTELFSSKNGRTAVEAMNARHLSGNWDLSIHMAEVWFCQIWRHFEQQHCSADELKEREDRIVEIGMRRSGYDLRSAIRGRTYVREFLSDKEARFNEYRRSFLMVDLFPENDVRFPLTYRDCIEAA